MHMRPRPPAYLKALHHELSLAPVNELPSPNKDADRGQDTNAKQDILNHPALSFTSSLSPSFLPGSGGVSRAHS